MKGSGLLESVECFIDAGLFQPSTTPYSITLHAINKVGDPRHTPYRAHENLLAIAPKEQP